MTDSKTPTDLDGMLAAAGSSSGGELPPMNETLRRVIGEGEPASPRRPQHRALLLIGAAAAWAAVLLMVLDFRRDLEHLPRAWLGTYLSAWFLAAAALAWGSQVPAAGRVMPRSALVGRLGILVGVVFTIAGLALARHVPGISTMPEQTLAEFLRFAPYCITVGLLTASLPLLGAAMLIRGAAPTGGRWLGAAMGAGTGSLGGLVLHLHCPVADRMHLGFVHGGVVLIAAIAGSLIVPRLIRTA